MNVYPTYRKNIKVFTATTTEFLGEKGQKSVIFGAIFPGKLDFSPTFSTG